MSTENEKSKKRKDLKQLYRHWFPSNTGDNLILDLQKSVPGELQDINYIRPIIAAYNPYLTCFVKNLLDLLQPSLPDFVAGRICALAQLISSPDKFPMSSLSTIYTVNDFNMTGDVMIIDSVQIEHTEQNKQQDNQDQMMNSIWRLASAEHNWSTCPIGQVPWQHNMVDVFDMETSQI